MKFYDSSIESFVIVIVVVVLDDDREDKDNCNHLISWVFFL